MAATDLYPLSSPTDISHRPSPRDSSIEWRSFLQRVDMFGYKIDQIEAVSIPVFKLQYNRRHYLLWNELAQFKAEMNDWADEFLYWDARLNRYFIVKATSALAIAQQGDNPAVPSFAVTLEAQPFVDYPYSDPPYYPTSPLVWWKSSRADLFVGVFSQETSGGGNPVYKSPSIYKSATTGAKAIWVYGGFGTKWYAPKKPAGGLVKLTIDGVVIANPGRPSDGYWDLYADPAQNSQVIYDGLTTTLNSALQLHQVILENMSTDPIKKELYVDALEFVQGMEAGS